MHSAKIGADTERGSNGEGDGWFRWEGVGSRVGGGESERRVAACRAVFMRQDSPRKGRRGEQGEVRRGGLEEFICNHNRAVTRRRRTSIFRIVHVREPRFQEEEQEELEEEEERPGVKGGAKWGRRVFVFGV